MIYKNKEQAEKAAEEFAIEKLKTGQFVRRYEEEDSFFINSTFDLGNAWKSEEFKYCTMRKGDIFWCWDLEKKHPAIYIYRGIY